MSGKDMKVWFPIKRGFFRTVVDHVKAVDGIDVTVRAGQTLGVVGESGSGKTTLGLALAAPDLVRRPDRFDGQRHRQAVLQRDAPAARATCRSSSRTPSARSARACRSSEIIEEGLAVHEPSLVGRASATRGWSRC